MSKPLKIALVKWNIHDELSEVIADELTAAGHEVQFFLADAELPPAPDLVLTFAPYGKFLPIARRAAAAPSHPLLAHWNFEGFPNLRLPWRMIYTAAALRSRIDHLPWLDGKFNRFRYVGDYFYAYERGWLGAFGVVSQIYERIYNAHGLPTQFVPWGTSPRWFRTLNLERDIDVLWFGKRRNARRSHWIDGVRADLKTHGYNMLVVDGVEHHFIYGAQRTEILNRTKIVLNVKTLEHNSGFTFRFHVVAGNRALIVSEDFLPHVPQYQAGVHFVSVPPEQMSESIVYYLEHENERAALAENAYQLVTTEMTLRASVDAFMRHVERAQNL